MTMTDNSFGDFEVSGFGSLKSPTTTNSTTAGSLFSGGSSEGHSSTKSEKKKKKKKKSDRSEGGSKRSSSSRRSADKKERLLEMTAPLNDEFAPAEFGDFGDFDDVDFGVHQQPLERASSQRSDDGSRRSGGNLSHKTPITLGTTDASRYTMSTVYTNGASSAKQALQLDGVTLEFPDEDLFADHHQPNFDDLPEGEGYDDDDEDYDDDSVLSELSGLTGVFSLVDMGTAAPSVEELDEQEEYLQSARQPYDASNIVMTDFAPSIKGGSSISGAPTSRSQSKATTKKTKKSLSFSTVTIRDYERILTENPATIRGVSIGVGWRYTQRPLSTLDKFEATRGPRRPSGALVVGPQAREDMLFAMGYTKKEMAVALRSINKSRNQRRQTVQNLKAEKVEEAFEGAGKKVKGFLNPFKKK